MIPGNAVAMNHPRGFATVTDSGGRFVGWIPNGVQGTIYLIAPEPGHAIVHFEGKLMATVSTDHLLFHPVSGKLLA